MESQIADTSAGATRILNFSSGLCMGILSRQKPEHILLSFIPTWSFVLLYGQHTRYLTKTILIKCTKVLPAGYVQGGIVLVFNGVNHMIFAVLSQTILDCHRLFRFLRFIK